MAGYFKSNYNDHEISFTASQYDPGGVFRSDALRDKEGTRLSYDSYRAITAALDRYDLSLRKNFTNHVAFMTGGYGDELTVRAVRVTSVNGQEAWIVDDEERSKVSIYRLYASENELNEYVIKYKALSEQRDALAKALTNWTPKGGEE